MLARSAQLCCLVVVSTTACLPDLDPSLRDRVCVGGVADGFLDDGEQCDDGNDVPGDGCAPSCRVECDGVVDPATSRCYFALAGELTAADARDECRTRGGAALVTLRSDDERALAASVMRPLGVTVAHTAYELAPPATVPLASGDETFFFAVASPSTVLREPGLLLASAPSGRRCPGCYPSAGLSFTAARDRIALGDGGLMVVGASARAGAVCERAPVGAPANRCPGVRCAPGAVVDVDLAGARYALFASAASHAEAEATCAAAMGGHLAWLESDAERARVVSLLAWATTSPLAWVGLAASDGRFVWSDGVEREGWLALDAPPLDGVVGALVLQPGAFDVGLVRPLADATAPIPFVCKSLNRR